MTERESEQEIEQEPITGQVAAILDERELLLDVGKASGATVGMRFAILGQADIETASGRIVKVDYLKTIVKIVRLQEDEFSVGRTFRTVPGRKGLPPLKDFAKVSYSPFIQGTRDIPPRPETIDTGGQEPALQGKRDTAVHPGDVARQTIGDEFMDTL